MKPKKAVLSSWGNHQRSDCLVFRPERTEELEVLLQKEHEGGIIAYANGLNYGDQAFNTNGHIIQTTRLDRMLSFDEKTGILVCESGVTFKDLLMTFLSRGWMPPVIPGTLNVTLGGAVANDVHGKNDHGYGSFGRHVLSIELITALGTKLLTPNQHTDLFFATIGGLGLTGVISQISLQMVKAPSSFVAVKTQRVKYLEQWIENLTNPSDKADFRAGWMDLSPQGIKTERGLLWSANFLNLAKGKVAIPAAFRQYPAVPVPFMQYTTALSCLNSVYFYSVPRKGKTQYQHLMNFINPLDKIKSWNKWYGRSGLYQLQCVIPNEAALSGLKTMMTCIKEKNARPGLAVIKSLSQEGPGLLSFTSPGITLAMDFHNRPDHKNTIKEITAIIQAHGGKIYLAKDALLDKAAFKKMYPNYEAFRMIREKYDLVNVFNSDLSRRLGI